MPERLLSRYYWYQAVSTATLFQAVYFVYYGQRIGLSLATILALQSYSTALRAALDLPLGALADRLSRRLCLVGAGTGVSGRGGRAGVAVAGRRMGGRDALRRRRRAALGRGLGVAVRHPARGRPADLYPHAESRGQAMASLGSGVAAVLGGLLAAVDLALPYLVTLITAATGAALAWTLDERRIGETAHAGASRGRMREAAGVAWRTPAIRWAIAVAMIAVTASHVYFYLQQPYLEAVGVPLALFGVVFAATKALTALVSASAYRIDAALGQRRAVALMTAVPACGLGTMAMVGVPAGALLILTRGLLDGLWMPLVNVYLNRLVGSRLRATMLSLQSVLARLTLALTLAVLGMLTARVGLPPTLAAVAVAIALSAGRSSCPRRGPCGVRACRERVRLAHEPRAGRAASPAPSGPPRRRGRWRGSRTRPLAKSEPCPARSTAATTRPAASALSGSSRTTRRWRPARIAANGTVEGDRDERGVRLAAQPQQLAVLVPATREPEHGVAAREHRPDQVRRQEHVRAADHRHGDEEGMPCDALDAVGFAPGPAEDRHRRARIVEQRRGCEDDAQDDHGDQGHPEQRIAPEREAGRAFEAVRGVEPDQRGEAYARHQGEEEEIALLAQARDQRGARTAAGETDVAAEHDEPEDGGSEHGVHESLLPPGPAAGAAAGGFGYVLYV